MIESWGQLGSNVKWIVSSKKGGASAYAYLVDCTLNQIQTLLKSIKWIYRLQIWYSSNTYFKFHRDLLKTFPVMAL